MKNCKKILLLIFIILFVISTFACGQKGMTPDNEKVPSDEVIQISLTVSAAASLMDVMEDVKTAYAKKNSNVTINYNFAGSGSLERQIEQGAQVDVFISAATKQMDMLKEKDLIIDDTRKNLLENKIVLVVPKDSLGVNGFEDLALDQVKTIAIGEPKSVPVGQYGKEVLTKLGIFDLLKAKTVYGKDVKEVITWVETGNADAGIVYETDAKVSEKVKIVAKAPEGSCSPVYYPAAVIKDSKNQTVAREFIDFLYSSTSKPIFEKYGFIFVEK